MNVHHKILIESDISKIRNGIIELLILLLTITQIILVNKYLQRILKYSVIWFYLKFLYYFFEILTNNQEFKADNENSNMKLILIFGLSTIVSYIFLH